MTKIEITASQTTAGYRVSLNLSRSAKMTAEELAEFVARFPKSLRVGTTTMTTYANGRNYNDGSVTIPWLSIRDFAFQANGTTGDKNEAAAKRLRSLLAKLEAMDDVEVVETMPYTNSVRVDEVLASN